MRYCSALSDHQGNILTGLSSIVLAVPTCLSRQLRGRKECPKTPFRFGLDQLLITPDDCNSVRVDAHKVWKMVHPPYQKELCNPASTEDRYMVLPDDLLSLLIM